MREFYRIGEVSQLFEIEISQLRYYDEIGLFKPMRVDKKTGYRSYHISQFTSLSTILMYRGLGIPIKVIKQRIMETTPEEMLTFIGEAEGRLKTQLTELQRRQRMLAAIEMDVKKAVEKENQFACIQSPDFLVLAYEREDEEREAQLGDMKDLSKKARQADPDRYTKASFFELFDKDAFMQGQTKRLVKGICLEEQQAFDLDYPIMKGLFCLHCFLEYEEGKGQAELESLVDFIKEQGLTLTRDILQIHVMRYIREGKIIIVREFFIPIEE
jgi:DNA-binding transcriptional MerR regulator